MEEHPIRGDKLYLLLLYGGVTLGLAGLAGIPRAHSDGAGLVLRLMAGCGSLLVVAAQVDFAVVLYRVWRHVIAECTRLGLRRSIDTPGKAVGYLFIPFYNLYWMFVVFGRLAADYNAIAAAENRPGRLSSGLGITMCIFVFLGLIPQYGMMAVAVNMLGLYPLFITRAAQFCRRTPPEPRVIEPRPLTTYSELFDFGRFGFNFWLAGALFFGAALYSVVQPNVFKDLLKGASDPAYAAFRSNLVISAAAGAVPFALVFALILQLARRDWLLPILAAAAELGLSLVRRQVYRWLIPEAHFSVSAFEVTLLIMGAVTMVVTIVLVRKMGAILASFVAANVIIEALWFGISIAREYGHSHSVLNLSSAPFFLGAMAGAVLSAALLYGAISYHLEESSFRLLPRGTIRTY